MTDPTVAVDLLEALEVRLQVPPQVTLNDDPFGSDDMGDLGELLVGQFTGARVRVDPCLLKDAPTRDPANAINIRKRSFNALLVGNVDAKYSSHYKVLIRKVFVRCDRIR